MKNKILGINDPRRPLFYYAKRLIRIEPQVRRWPDNRDKESHVPGHVLKCPGSNAVPTRISWLDFSSELSEGIAQKLK